MTPLIAGLAALRALLRRHGRSCSWPPCSLVYFKLVRVKMLPFDNKSEFQVIVDMPEGTTLEQTARVTPGAGRRPGRRCPR